MGLRRINFDDLQWQKSYSPWNAYCQSKLADLIMTVELARRVSANDGMALLTTAAHPGYARTDLQTSGPGKAQSFVQKLAQRIGSQDAAQGALPTLRGNGTGHRAGQLLRTRPVLPSQG